MKLQNVKTELVRCLAAIAIAVTFTMAAFAGGTDKKTAAGQNLAGRCNAVTLKSAYGYRISGTFFVSPTTPLLLASVGRMVFDGAGNVADAGTNSFNGSVAPYEATGTYTVNPDCSGELTLSYGGGIPPLTNSFVITDEGKSIFYIESAPGAVLTGEMRRQ